MQELKFPIGEYTMPENISSIDIKQAIQDIATLPEDLMDITLGLNPKDLLHEYRPGGWNIKQVIHHLADSHMNAFIRFKLVFTEGDGAKVRPYEEGLWATTDDVDDSIEDSLMILRGIHNRWVKLLRSFSHEDFQNGYYHPEMKQNVPLYKALGLYQWHGRHHFAHIVNAMKNVE